jgi:hypothetical protein
MILKKELYIHHHDIESQADWLDQDDGLKVGYKDS